MILIQFYRILCVCRDLLADELPNYTHEQKNDHKHFKCFRKMDCERIATAEKSTSTPQRAATVCFYFYGFQFQDCEKKGVDHLILC